MKNTKQRKQLVEWQYRAGVLSESAYLKKMQLLEDDALNTDKPIPLSQLAAKKSGAMAAVGGGLQDENPTDDMVGGKKVMVPVGKLKPAQIEVIKEKAFGMAVGMLLKGKWEGLDLGAIVSSDNYIMDGHHRWAAVSLIDPKAQLQVIKIDLPGGPLVTTLNLVTVGKLGITKGNKGKGDVKTFTGDNIGQVIDNALQNGIPGEFPLKPEQVEQALKKMPGANGDVQAAKELMMQNADLLPKKIMPGAPPRVEMPVISPEKVAMVQKMIEKGTIDIKPPFSAKVQSQLNLKESVKRLDNLLKQSIKSAR